MRTTSSASRRHSSVNRVPGVHRPGLIACPRRRRARHPNRGNRRPAVVSRCAAAMDYRGGCLCGSLRFCCQGQPVDVGYCHCRLCQRSTGAPVLAWATFGSMDFVYTKSKPQTFLSSPRGQREFCAKCGTQIAFSDTAVLRTVDVKVGSFDTPEAFQPEYHIWTESRIP